jgi:hypothetical protein
MPPKVVKNGKKQKEEDEAYHQTAAGKVKKEKDPNAIKKPMSSYFMYMNSQRASVKTKNPTA